MTHSPSPPLLPPCTLPCSSSLLSLSLSLSPRFSLSSFCLIVFSLVAVSRVVCGVRAARCQSRRVLGVSRVVRSHRVVRSLASSPLLSSRVVCRRVVRSCASLPRLSSRCASSSCSVSVASCADAPSPSGNFCHDTFTIPSSPPPSLFLFPPLSFLPPDFKILNRVGPPFLLVPIEFPPGVLQLPVL